MGRNLLRVGVHFVWATWDRLPLVSEQIERELHRYITTVCEDDHCELLAVGGLSDHVHLLVLLPSTLTLGNLMKHVKGGSSRFVSRTLCPGEWFAWQGSYGAISVGPHERTKVITYIENQKQRHAENNLWPNLERCQDEKEDLLTPS